MKKEFQYRGISMEIKTNLLKNHVCYFGVKDIKAEFERACKEATYLDRRDTAEQTLLDIYRRLTSRNIKPDYIRMGSLTYGGENMTEFGKEKVKELTGEDD